MRKTLAAAMAAITLGGAVCATVTPAQAHDDWDHNYRGDYGRHDRNDNGAAVAAGVLGLALGAALASNSNSHSYGRDYGYGYSSYGYGPQYDGYYERPYYSYRTCETERWVWDPYIGRYVPVRTRYAC